MTTPTGDTGMRTAKPDIHPTRASCWACGSGGAHHHRHHPEGERYAYCRAHCPDCPPDWNELGGLGHMPRGTP